MREEGARLRITQEVGRQDLEELNSKFSNPTAAQKSPLLFFMTAKNRMWSVGTPESCGIVTFFFFLIILKREVHSGLRRCPGNRSPLSTEEAALSQPTET